MVQGGTAILVIGKPDDLSTGTGGCFDPKENRKVRRGVDLVRGLDPVASSVQRQGMIDTECCWRNRSWYHKGIPHS